MEKNWEKYVKVFNDMLVFGVKYIYLILHLKPMDSKPEN
jgi:hypothetical protein